MNIGLFTETYYPEINGVANSVYMLKEQLERMGHNAYVFTTTTPGAPEKEHNVFRVKSIPCAFLTERRIGMFYSPKLANIIKGLNLDVIHTNTEFSLGIFGRIMARELDIPVIHTYHTIYEDYTHYIAHFRAIDRRAKSFVRAYSKFCCNSAGRVIVPTDKVRQLLGEYKVNQEIAIIPTGIDLDKFRRENYNREEIEEIKKELGIGADEKVILYIGRVSQEKNIAEVIDGFAEYVRHREKVRLLIVGSGPELDKLKEQGKKLGLEDEIIFAGARPWDEIGKYYLTGDVFVSASQSETQGLTYIEAMAAGLPVVAKKDACLNGIVKNGVNGYQTTGREEFVTALDDVLNPEKWPEYSRQALLAVKPYSKEFFAESILSLYEEIQTEGEEAEAEKSSGGYPRIYFQKFVEMRRGLRK
ncbi:MAG: glycosyltransferase family 4 protein [Lachnospiraceae bacterium]|nr:glycosyltransferase family 4 protein [Lachnospiraceae bacterium]